MSDNLHHDLEDLAQEVRIVDLRDRALRTSRRLAAWRTILTSAAALLLVAGIGSIALVRINSDRAAPPASPTPTTSTALPTTATPTGTTNPIDFNFPAPPASATKLGPWTSAPAQTLPGRAYFLSWRQPEAGNDGATTFIADLVVLGDGAARVSPLGRLSNQGCLMNSISVSPDGTHVAWQRGEMFADAAQVVSVNLTTRRSSAIGEGGDCASRPKWGSDSRSVVYAGRDVAAREVSLDTGTATDVPRERADDYRAIGAEFSAYGDNDRIVVVDKQGNDVSSVAYETTWPGGFGIQAVSHDGRFVGLNFRPTDPDPVRTVARVVDARTGEDVVLPLKEGEQLVTMLFLPDGGMLLATIDGQVSYLRLVAVDGTVTASVTHTYGLLLHYVP